MWSRADLRADLGRALNIICTRAWTAGIRLGARSSKDVTQWDSSGGNRVLVVAPHPDDEVAGCGGTILLHRSRGDHVTVLHVTDGRASRALGLDPDEMATQRRAEASASTAVADVSRWEWLGLREGEWLEQDLLSPLEVLLRELTPNVIYLPSRVDFHPEHRRVARVVARSSVFVSLTHASIRIYQVHVPLTHVLVNLVAPITPVLLRARNASDQYTSQKDSLMSPFRLKRYAAAMSGLEGAAEEFWEMSTSMYAAVHREDLLPPLPFEAFRGLRRLAMADPLAFARGRSERHRLRSFCARWATR